jgi:dihydroneopterin aldolase / 2-amino-4-hydroxy-6-hydroxymethyldihydropteridine diphosphokinase
VRGPESPQGDLVTLRGVTAYGYHGVFDVERREGQEFVVDVEMGVDLGPAAATDELHRTVHYGEVAATVVEVVEGPPCDLIEKVAGLVADRVLATQPLVETVSVTVHKPQAPVGVPFGDVAVSIRRTRDVPVVIALGANLEDPVRTVQEAGRRLHRVRGLRRVRLSRLYGTDPVGGPQQPDYVNAVAVGRTRLTAGSLLAALHDIEADFGRTREVRWGARTLDLDLIQWGDPAAGTDLVSEDPELVLPHPRAHQRAFVLVPWAQVDPAAVLRVGKEVRAVAELADETGDAGVRPLAEPG